MRELCWDKDGSGNTSKRHFPWQLAFRARHGRVVTGWKSAVFHPWCPQQMRHVFLKKKKENAFGVNQNLKKNIVTENAISNNKDVTTVHQYRLWILDIEQRGLLVSILLAWLVTGDNIRSLCLTVLKVLDTKRDGFANRLLSLVLFTSEVTLGRGENTLSRI